MMVSTKTDCPVSNNPTWFFRRLSFAAIGAQRYHGRILPIPALLMTLPLPQTTPYRASIDGIRAIAVLSVVVFHLFPEALPGGYLGVDIFFVISGYLITGIILRENHQGNFSFANFYSRRIKRIFPALFAVLMLTALVATFLLTPVTYTNFMKSARYAAAQLANFFFAQHVGYFEEGFSGQPLLHTWSLGVEEQFYLFWPLLIVVLFHWFSATQHRNRPAGATGKKSINRKIAASFGLIGVLSFSGCWYLVEINQQLAFYMFYTRAWEFCLGGLVCLLGSRTPVSAVANGLIELTGLACLLASVVFIGETVRGVSFLRFGVIVPCLGTALLLFASSQSGLISRALASPVPVFFGKISYSLYLFHWPVIILYKLYRNHQVLNPGEGLALFAASALCAFACYHLIEQPARKSTLPSPIVIAMGLSAIVTGMTVFNNLEPLHHASWRITKYAEQQNEPPPWYPQNCRNKGKGGIIYYECINYPDAAAPVLALVGDSHAPHYLHGAVAWAAQRGYNVNFLSVAGCPMLLGEISYESRIDSTQNAPCNRALPFFTKAIAANPKVQLVLVAQRFDLLFNGIGFANTDRVIFFRDAQGDIIPDHQAYYRKQLGFTVDTLQNNGKQVILLKQVPLLGSISDCDWEPRLKRLFNTKRACEYDQRFIAKWQQPSMDFVDEFARAHQLEMIDPLPFFSSPLVDGINLYQNTDHLNSYGFHHMIPFVVQALDDIIKTSATSPEQPYPK